MSTYSDIPKEETFKAAVFRDFFISSKYAYEPNIGNIDFIVTEAKTLKGNIWTRHYLWAESKKGIADIHSMLTQLVLTVKKTYEKGEHLPPPYIACFDTAKIAFVPFHDILPIFSDNDVNWNVTPSNHTTDDFLKTKKKVEELSKENIVIFNFETDKQEIVNFINQNLVAGNITAKFQINKNNFVIIYTKWLDKVKKSIGIDWSLVKKSGIIDGDFFLADLLSKDNYTLKDKLFVVLMNNQYKFDKKFDEAGFSLYKEVGFNDSQKAHKEFWDKYDRPPIEEYWDYIINRRDLLVPQDIRERKGSFFTPRQWVELSQKYIGDVLGEDWQDEYVVWDCAAGTGNLLAGLTNKKNIWASTLDTADVDVMKDRIKNGANLFENQVFQFDFLNDDFSKLPKGLLDIINSEEKRKKLIIYINPPYAEVATTRERHGTGQSKNSIEQSLIHDKYDIYLGIAKKELFAQFLTRIYFEIPDCIIGEFSKLKALSGPNFILFRQFFKAKLEKSFIVLANTFDNVTGKFPIGFKVWDTEKKEIFKEAVLDIIDINGDYIGQKKIYSYDDCKFINDWLIAKREKHIKDEDKIGYLGCYGNDFLNQKICRIHRTKEEFGTPRGNFITKQNISDIAVYYAVRKCIEATWLNDRDQFLWPSGNFDNDEDFKNNCLVYTLFNNNISSNYGINHWIPYSETDVNVKSKFASSFMYDFINGKISNSKQEDLFSEKKKTKIKALSFSDEANAVLKAGKELWKYYHSQPSVNVNASYYDIREFFQGRDDDSGKMNNKSGDDTYNALISELRSAQKTLALKIQPKVYEYGFLME